MENEFITASRITIGEFRRLSQDKFLRLHKLPPEVKGNLVAATFSLLDECRHKDFIEHVVQAVLLIDDTPF